MRFSGSIGRGSRCKETEVVIIETKGHPVGFLVSLSLFHLVKQKAAVRSFCSCQCA